MFLFLNSLRHRNYPTYSTVYPAQRRKWRGREEEKKEERTAAYWAVNSVTHSDCGYEQAKMREGKSYGGKDKIESKKDRNSEGKACFLSVCDRREREETDGAWRYPPPSFSSSLLLTLPLLSLRCPPPLTLKESSCRGLTMRTVHLTRTNHHPHELHPDTVGQ